LEPKEAKDWVDLQLTDATIQKRIVLVIVSIALLLDNMLYMVIGTFVVLCSLNVICQLSGMTFKKSLPSNEKSVTQQ
jgi:hypothetical protein